MSPKDLLGRWAQLIVPPPIPEPNQVPIRVLVVEDEAARHERWIEKLDQPGIDLEIVSSERQARRLIQNENFDILVLNWNLYDGNGRTVLETWIDRQSGDEPSVVFSTNPTGDDLITRALKIGAHNVLKKNGDDDLFTRLVGRYVRHVQREKALVRMAAQQAEILRGQYQLRLALLVAGFIVVAFVVLAIITYPELIKAVM